MGVVELLCTISLAMTVLSDQAPFVCNPMTACEEMLSDIDTELPHVTDQEISTFGHLSGVQPESSDIHLRFQDRVHFVVSTNISVKINRTTRYIMVNIHGDVPFDVIKQMLIYNDCIHISLYLNCIEHFHYKSENGLLVMRMRNPLSDQIHLTLSFPSFSGTVYNPVTETGSTGLRWAGEEDFEAVYSTFLAKRASTVFPCFNHPVFKTRFRLCLEYPNDYMAVSSAASSGTSYAADASHNRQCFEETPPIPAYTLAFAIMKTYGCMYIVHPNTQVFAPESRIQRFADLKSKLLAALRIVQNNITNTQPSFQQINMLVLYGFQGSLPVDNAGLIMVDGEKAEGLRWANSRGGDFYRSVAHQWIGAVFSVSQWGELCLQKGLAQYVQWYLWDKIDHVSIVGMARQAVLNIKRKKSQVLSNKMLIYEDSYDVECEDHAVAVFYMVAEAFGITVFNRFVAELAQVYNCSSATMDDWDVTLARVTEADNMRGFINNWFMQPLVQLDLSVDYIGGHINMSVTSASNSVIFRPLPLRITLDGETSLQAHVMASNSSQMPLLKNPKWFIVDPNNVALVSISYNSVSYYEMLLTLAGPYKNAIPLTYVHNYFVQFCDSILNNAVPHANDQSNERWKQVFQRAVQLDRTCDCCLVRPSERESAGCFETLNERCSKSHLLVKLLYS